MPQTARRHHHRHLDFTFAPAAGGSVRLSVHSAEILRGVLGGDLSATGYKPLGEALLPAPVADALDLALGDLRTDLDPEADEPAPAHRRHRRQRMAERLEAFFTRHRGNPLVANGVVVDPNSDRGKRLVAQIRAGQAEPRLLAEWVRLRIEWRQIIEGV